MGIELSLTSICAMILKTSEDAIANVSCDPLAEFCFDSDKGNTCRLVSNYLPVISARPYASGMSCNIILQDRGTYRPGSTISGHVLCTFNSEKKIRGVTVKLRGREHTSWTESESYHDSQTNETKYRDVTYGGDRKFLSVDICLLGEQTMAPGRYEYPFSFTLPRNLPMNFQGSYGYVKHYLKATVDIPFAFDYEEMRNINLYAPIDFNDIRSQLQMWNWGPLYPSTQFTPNGKYGKSTYYGPRDYGRLICLSTESRAPALSSVLYAWVANRWRSAPCLYQDEKTICCCCCASGPITVDVHLPKEAFVVGEVVKIKIEVTNLSNETIEGVHVRLNQIIVSKATSPSGKSKCDSELLAATSDTGVGAHGERTYELDLEIPRSAAVYNFNGCTLFSQSFVLKVEVCMPVFHTNMGIKTAVIVGHIPLTVAQNNPSPYSVISTDARPPPPNYAQGDQPPTYLASNNVPPYPTGHPGFMSASTTDGHLGFSSPAGMPPVPVHGEHPHHLGSGCLHRAPLDDTAPSAPFQAEATEAVNFVVVNSEGPSTGLSNVPPPTYYDAVRALSSNQPSAHSPYPSGQTGASAPLFK